MPDLHRVVLFIDYQNAYSGAREAFFQKNDFHSKGQFHPTLLGNNICGRDVTRMPRELGEVRVYAGLPSSSREPRSYGARMRQISGWEKLGITVVPRTLRYPRDWPSTPAQEKGIDVKLAVDLVMLKMQNAYDVGIVFSGDTDLLPALEAVCDLAAADNSPFPEVCSWGQPRSGRPRLRVAGKDIRCHWFDRNQYRQVQDTTDYNIPRVR